MPYVIDSDIPVPPRGRQKTAISLVLEQLGTGDSVLFPSKERKAVETTLANVRSRTRRRFAARTLSNGVRVWRVA